MVPFAGFFNISKKLKDMLNHARVQPTEWSYNQ
jgi:hypothetical protein